MIKLGSDLAAIAGNRVELPDRLGQACNENLLVELGGQKQIQIHRAVSFRIVPAG